MATEDNFIVAIELGSSKVTGVAGCKQPDGAIQILAFAQEPSTTFIRKGRVYNVNKMTQCLKNMKESLEQQMQKRISRVYVGIGGMGMHTVMNTVNRQFDSKVEVTQEMIDSMCDENTAMTNPDREILEPIPQEFRLGTQLTNEPVGVLSENIEGRFLNIVANSAVREELRNCFRAANILIEDQPITVQALADTILTEPEKRSGCVFVDMGAETTSVAIYKNNLLRHLAVIPLGGANVNRDIMSLQIEEDEAEQLKLKYGTAIADTENEHQPIRLSDGRSVKYEDFSGLVEARMEEIIANINNQIALSKYEKGQLIGGIVVTGGASLMRDIDKAFLRETHIEKLRFVRSLRIPLRVNKDVQGFNNDNGDCNAAIAILDKGEQNCNGGDLGQLDLFAEQEEAERKQAEEEAKRKEEEEKKAELEKLKELDELRKLKEEEELRKQKEKEKRKKKYKSIISRTKRFFETLVKDEQGDD